MIKVPISNVERLDIVFHYHDIRFTLTQHVMVVVIGQPGNVLLSKFNGTIDPENNVYPFKQPIDGIRNTAFTENATIHITFIDISKKDIAFMSRHLNIHCYTPKEKHACINGYSDYFMKQRPYMLRLFKERKSAISTVCHNIYELEREMTNEQFSGSSWFILTALFLTYNSLKLPALDKDDRECINCMGADDAPKHVVHSVQDAFISRWTKRNPTLDPELYFLTAKFIYTRQKETDYSRMEKINKVLGRLAYWEKSELSRFYGCAYQDYHKMLETQQKVKEEDTTKRLKDLSIDDESAKKNTVEEVFFRLFQAKNPNVVYEKVFFLTGQALATADELPKVDFPKQMQYEMYELYKEAVKISIQWVQDQTPLVNEVPKKESAKEVSEVTVTLKYNSIQDAFAQLWKAKHPDIVYENVYFIVGEALSASAKKTMLDPNMKLARLCYSFTDELQYSMRELYEEAVKAYEDQTEDKSADEYCCVEGDDGQSVESSQF